MIGYRVGNDIDLDAFIDVYRDSTLGERRPVDDRARMQQMLERANLVVSAWDGDLLIGIARSLSDFCYATYLSDIAVRIAYQRRGVGRELVRRDQAAPCAAEGEGVAGVHAASVEGEAPDHPSEVDGLPVEEHAVLLLDTDERSRLGPAAAVAACGRAGAHQACGGVEAEPEPSDCSDSSSPLPVVRPVIVW